MRRVEEVDDGRQHLPHQAARALDDGVGRHIARAAGLGHVFNRQRARALQPLGQQGAFAALRGLHGHARHGGRCGHRLHTALVAAMAARPVLVHTDVAHIARRAIGAPVHLPVAHNAAANARAHFNHQEVGQIALQPVHLAQRHQVHVVVHKHRRGKRLAQVVADRETVPVGHQRRVDELPAFKIHRPRHAHANGNHLVGRQPAARQQLAHQPPHPRQDHARPLAHINRLAVPRQHRHVGPHHRYLHAGRAQVGANHHAQGFAQTQGFGAPAARGFLQAHLVEQAFIQQRRHHGVGLALGIGQALRQRIARRACGPEDGLQDAQVFSAAVTPAGGWQGLSPVMFLCSTSWWWVLDRDAMRSTLAGQD